MHAIAVATGGTFSFIEKEAAVQDSLAQCIGGLLSVAVQEARVVVECLHPGVHVRAVKFGGRYYDSLIGMGGRAASVDVGELYADEERRFLLFLGVPVAAAAGDGRPRRRLGGRRAAGPRQGCVPEAAAAEQLAAGWPPWLVAVAGEALRGWAPRRADTFEKLNKVGGSPPLP